jgi:hypothetical protein
MQASNSRLQPDFSSRQKEDSDLCWTPFDFRGYLESREGKVWSRQDTLKLLGRVEQVDALVERLIRAAGIQIVERN